MMARRHHSCDWQQSSVAAKLPKLPGWPRCMPGVMISLVALTLSGVAPVAADTLQDAMIAAMRHYPPVLAEAARKQAAVAGIGVARAGLLPRVTATGDVGLASGDRGLGAGAGNTTPGLADSPFGTDWAARWGYSLLAEQSIYDGGRTRSSIAEAQAGAEAAGAQVRVVEQLVLMEVVTVYADLVRDRAVENLRVRDVAALADQVQSLRERELRRDATITDVAQARARHAQSLADLISAKANVSARTTEYTRVVGRAPGKLERARMPQGKLPASLDAALAGAYAGHPAATVVASKEDASRYAVDRQRADGLPQVKLRGGVEGEHNFTGGGPGRDSASASVRVAIPLFDGGETAARVEQAHQLSLSAREETRGLRDRLHANVVMAWTGLDAARKRIVAEREAVKESQRVLGGLKEEMALGQRSVIDLLDAQRELVASQVRVEAGERDLLVAAYALLSAVGGLRTPDHAGPAAPQARSSPVDGWNARVVKDDRSKASRSKR
jgi:outer membrane protein